MRVERLHLKFPSSTIHLFMHEYRGALNVLYASLNVSLFFKQHPYSWHDLSGLS